MRRPEWCSRNKNTRKKRALHSSRLLASPRCRRCAVAPLPTAHALCPYAGLTYRQHEQDEFFTGPQSTSLFAPLLVVDIQQFQVAFYAGPQARRTGPAVAAPASVRPGLRPEIPASRACSSLAFFCGIDYVVGFPPRSSLCVCARVRYSLKKSRVVKRGCWAIIIHYWRMAARSQALVQFLQRSPGVPLTGRGSIFGGGGEPLEAARPGVAGARVTTAG